MAAELPRRRLADPATGRRIRHRRADSRPAAGHRPLLTPFSGARAALCLHLLLPWHAAAGATVPGLLRPGAVRCGAPGAVVAVPARSVLVRHYHHDPAHGRL